MFWRQLSIWTGVIAVLGIMILFGGCSAQFEAAEKGVIEPKVDQAYDETVKRWCRFPPDVQVRALERGTIRPRSLTDTCPEWRSLRDAMIGERSEFLTRQDLKRMIDEL